MLALGYVEPLHIAHGSGRHPLGYGDPLLFARCQRQRVKQIAQGQALVLPDLRQVEDIPQAQGAGDRNASLDTDGVAANADELIAKTVHAHRLVDRHPVHEAGRGGSQHGRQTVVPVGDGQLAGAGHVGQRGALGQEYALDGCGARLDQPHQHFVGKPANHRILLEADIAGVLTEFHGDRSGVATVIGRFAEAPFDAIDQIEQCPDDALWQRLQGLAEQQFAQRRATERRHRHHARVAEIGSANEAQAEPVAQQGAPLDGGDIRQWQIEHAHLVGDDAATKHTAVGHGWLHTHPSGRGAVGIERQATNVAR